MPLAELYANPTARYNGELIDKDLKLVERRERPADYKYGDVNADATPLLFVGAIATIGLAAIVPSFLAVGDTAKRPLAVIDPIRRVLGSPPNILLNILVIS